ncbi:MAG: NAD(P)H-dependent oxidoreductase subunit E [Pseudomonadota bacterium]
MDTKKILDIIQKNDKSKGGLISILEEIQEEYTYLPEIALRQVAKETGNPLADIYGVATFYKAFSLKPRGKHCVSACLGTACHVRGAQRIVEEFTQQLGITPGETTPDNEITFETVNCLGACALGPIVVSDGHYFANVTARKVKEIIRDTNDGTYGSDEESKGYEFPIEAFCPRCNRSLMDIENCLDGYPSILITVSMEGKSGWVRIPSLYGHFARVHEHEIPKNTIVSMLCPYCRSILQDSFSCVECGAPLASMKINGGDGVLRICTREGCNGHLLELNGTVF